MPSPYIRGTDVDSCSSDCRWKGWTMPQEFDTFHAPVCLASPKDPCQRELINDLITARDEAQTHLFDKWDWHPPLGKDQNNG